MTSKKAISILCAIFIAGVCSFQASYAQEVDPLSISAKIIDAKTAEAIPYATIYNLRNANGTMSNLAGEFYFVNCLPNDSIRISFIGYETKFFLAKELQEKKIIYLSTRAEILGELTIYGDDNFLYALLAKSKKTTSSKVINAKTYFSLETFIDSIQVEWLEGYYNGVFRGYEVDDLNLKNGRIALAAQRNKFFVSISSSKAQYAHRIFEYNFNFPASPFEYSKSGIKKNFKLKLSNSYKNDDGNTIMVVDFTPKRRVSASFTGRVWIDSADASIQKIALECIDASIFPFHPLWATDTLKQVDLSLVKTFSRVENRMTVNSIDFNYRLYYQDRNDSLYVVNTHNMVVAYDYNEFFMLPFFDFGVNEENDYRKVNAAPYNDFFWENMEEFAGYDRKQTNELFLKRASFDQETMFFGNSFFVKGFFEQPYVFWSPKRIMFKETNMQLENTDVRSTMATDLYSLDVQLYMDVNYLNDSLHVLTRTVLDPFTSFFYFPTTAKSTAFLNMYFDLMEIQRRELEVELNENARSAKEAEQIYNRKMYKLNQLSNSFFLDVERGNNKEGMLKWNEIIFQELKINNWEFFQLELAFKAK
jgi:hypothetical protein